MFSCHHHISQVELVLSTGGELGRPSGSLRRQAVEILRGPLPGRVVPYADHAVPRYNGAFPKWREGRASGCWFPVCPETGELLLGTSCYASKEDKREEDLKNSHVTCVSRVRAEMPRTML